jgi:hypothetical protein
MQVQKFVQMPMQKGVQMPMQKWLSISWPAKTINRRTPARRTRTGIQAGKRINRRRRSRR